MPSRIVMLNYQWTIAPDPRSGEAAAFLVFSAEESGLAVKGGTGATGEFTEINGVAWHPHMLVISLSSAAELVFARPEGELGEALLWQWQHAPVLWIVALAAEEVALSQQVKVAEQAWANS